MHPALDPFQLVGVFFLPHSLVDLTAEFVRLRQRFLQVVVIRVIVRSLLEYLSIKIIQRSIDSHYESIVRTAIIKSFQHCMTLSRWPCHLWNIIMKLHIHWHSTHKYCGQGWAVGSSSIEKNYQMTPESGGRNVLIIFKYTRVFIEFQTRHTLSMSSGYLVIRCMGFRR